MVCKWEHFVIISFFTMPIFKWEKSPQFFPPPSMSIICQSVTDWSSFLIDHTYCRMIAQSKFSNVDFAQYLASDCLHFLCISFAAFILEINALLWTHTHACCASWAQYTYANGDWRFSKRDHTFLSIDLTQRKQWSRPCIKTVFYVHQM